MVKKQIIIITILACTMMACSQNKSLGPGYQFTLFKNTPDWELAKAVEREDTTAIRKLITDGKLDINLQEPQFGRTLLLLAVGNDELLSTKVLLEMGANLNIADSSNYKPIHEASRFISLKKNTLQILTILLKFGANANDTLIHRNGKDTSYFYVPLMGACENVDCAKLLLNNGANLYVKVKDNYLIWDFLLMTTKPSDENIYLAKYIIVDKRMPVPNPIGYSFPDKAPLDIFHFLKLENFNGVKNKLLAKQEIVNYLNRINFPKNGIYSESK